MSAGFGPGWPASFEICLPAELAGGVVRAFSYTLACAGFPHQLLPENPQNCLGTLPVCQSLRDSETQREQMRGECLRGLENTDLKILENASCMLSGWSSWLPSKTVAHACNRTA